jgi:acetyl esterase/lipase
MIRLLALVALLQAAPPQEKPLPKRPTPTVADYAYGTDSERQKLDFWKAEGDKPAPLILMIHGGGWVNGSKEAYGGIEQYLAAGFCVASINYRYIAIAMEQKVEPPVKAPLYDAARALQTLRSKAKEWNIDPTRVGATGGSAGACTSLWLAFHDDLADPKSSDPVARESTRLQCAAVSGAQTSLDPKELREWIVNSIYGGHAFGFAQKGRKRDEEFELLMANREKVLPWIKEYSPIELVSKDDPPVYLTYPQQKKPPVAGEKEPDPTHSVIYGTKLAERIAPLGFECVVTSPSGPKDEKYGSVLKFFEAKLKPK